MSYNFYAYLSRMRYIERWSMMHSSVKENIMEHSEQVAQVAHALALIRNKFFGGNVDADRCVSLAVFHECSEVITGDLPTPIKYYNNEIKIAYKKIEAVANNKLLTMLPEEFQSEYTSLIMPNEDSDEYRLVKAADKLSAYLKCVEELKVGNKEFQKAEKSIRKELEKLDMPEVNYFLEHFLSGFKKTLDELE